MDLPKAGILLFALGMTLHIPLLRAGKKKKVWIGTELSL